MGQCYPVPDDDKLKGELAKHTRNHSRIWHMYNFTKTILPGSDMAKARRLGHLTLTCTLLQAAGLRLCRSVR